ncbi:MAG: DUF6883 domain-containing protein [Micropepsaceae bacterium]
MPHLPNADLAYVEDAKLSSYILNPGHKEGWPKGRFLVSHGFAQDDLEVLRAALLRHGRENEVTESEQSAFGVKYRVDGPLSTPVGNVIFVRTVWQIDVGQMAPRFVTFTPIGATK